MIMKKTVWLATMLALGLTLCVKADDDGVNVGQSIDLVRRNPSADFLEQH